MSNVTRILPNTIGGRIQKLRTDKNLTQAELGKELGVKRETINQWESGTRDLKTDYTIKLSVFFNVSCDYILRGIKSENVDIHNRIGLSDESIEFLETCLKESTDNSITKTINKLLENRYTLGLINLFLQYSMQPEKINNNTYLETETGEPLISVCFKYKGIDTKALHNPNSIDPDEYHELLTELDMKKILLLKIQDELQKILL